MPFQTLYFVWAHIPGSDMADLSHFLHGKPSYKEDTLLLGLAFQGYMSHPPQHVLPDPKGVAWIAHSSLISCNMTLLPPSQPPDVYSPGQLMLTLSKGSYLPENEPGDTFYRHSSFKISPCWALSQRPNSFSLCNSALSDPTLRNSFSIIYLEILWLLFLAPLRSSSLFLFLTLQSFSVPQALAWTQPVSCLYHLLQNCRGPGFLLRNVVDSLQGFWDAENLNGAIEKWTPMADNWNSHLVSKEGICGSLSGCDDWTK